MDRRALLSSLASVGVATGAAGCVGQIDNVDGGDSSIDVSFDAEVLRPFDEDGPARLELTFANTADEPLALRPGTMRGIAGPFTAIQGERDDGRELLLFYRGTDVDSYALCEGTTESPIPDAPVDGCWRPPCEEGLEVITAHATVELDPDEELVGEYTVLDGFDDGCLRPGTYEFEDGTAVGPVATDEEGSGAETESLERRLSIEIDEAGAISATAEVVVEESDD